jgi:hypothetical protein
MHGELVLTFRTEVGSRLDSVDFRYPSGDFRSLLSLPSQGVVIRERRKRCYMEQICSERQSGGRGGFGAFSTALH